MASVAGGSSSPEAAATVPVGFAPAPARLAAAAGPLALGALRVGAGRDSGAADAYSAAVSAHVDALIWSRVDGAAAPPVLRGAVGASRQRPSLSAAGAVQVPAGSVGAGGAAAAAAASAASGVGMWLLLAALASIAVFFCRLILLPAAPRPVPFISLLERPG